MTSISQLKARLSAYLEIVRHGDDVLITDRGRVIARLTPVDAGGSDDGRRDELIRSGRMRPATDPLPKNFWSRPHPPDADGISLGALLEERTEGW